MANNAVQYGNILTFVAPAGGVVSGAPVVIGSFFTIPSITAAAGEEFEGELIGVWELNKVPANTTTVGAKAYWNAGASQVTTTEGSNRLVGAFTNVTANGDATAYVRLNGLAV